MKCKQGKKLPKFFAYWSDFAIVLKLLLFAGSANVLKCMIWYHDIWWADMVARYLLPIYHPPFLLLPTIVLFLPLSGLTGLLQFPASASCSLNLLKKFVSFLLLQWVTACREVSDEHWRWNCITGNMGEAEKGIQSSVENFSMIVSGAYGCLHFKVTLFILELCKK